MYILLCDIWERKFSTHYRNYLNSDHFSNRFPHVSKFGLLIMTLNLKLKDKKRTCFFNYFQLLIYYLNYRMRVLSLPLMNNYVKTYYQPVAEGC